MEIGHICYSYIFIYYVIPVVAWVLCNVGRVKCQQFIKHCNHWKQAQKTFFKNDLFGIQSSDYGAASAAKVTYSLPEYGPL